MPKKIVIIESDAAFSSKLRGAFEQRSLAVVETQDGKGAVDIVKREKPDLVVLAVELSAGQSGYIVCGKLKKDDDLKKIPVIIAGKDAEGFEAHKRLKARAEEYLKKPFEPAAILEKIGELIGLPAADDDGLLLENDESLTLSSLGEDEPLLDEEPAERTVIAKALPREEPTRGGDPDLDMLDAAFDTISEPEGEEAVKAPEDDGLIEDPPAVDLSAIAEESSADEALDSLGSDEPAESTKPGGEPAAEFELDALEPLEEEPAPAPPPRAAAKPAATKTSTGPVASVKTSTGPVASASRTGGVATVARPAVDDGELKALREKVEELEGQVRTLQDEVTAKDNELDAVKSTSGGKDKEFFSLKEQVTKKDKEIVRLKQDLNEKEQEVIELREKENGFEQKASEATAELAKKDAQIKTLTTRVDGAAAERKKIEQQLAAAKDEARAANAKLATAQGELDQAQEQAAELQGSLDAARAEADEAKGSLESLRVERDQLQTDLDEARANAEKLSSVEEEAASLRSKVSELEDGAAKSEERVVKAYQKIKSDEKLREKTRKALAVALQMLDEASSSAGGEDELSDEIATG